MAHGKSGSLALKLLLWFVSLSHIALGGAIMLSPSFQTKAAEFYAAQVDWTPQFVYILRPLGAFMLALGLAAAAAALDPPRYRLVIYCVALLLLVRVGQRIVYRDEIVDVFAIDATRNLINAGFFLLLALGLLVLAATSGRREA